MNRRITDTITPNELNFIELNFLLKQSNFQKSIVSMITLTFKVI